MHVATTSAEFIRVGTLEELKDKGMLVVAGCDRPLVVVHHQGRVFALDNRCPHLGFPLHRGSVCDGILTCHWHHARFDLSSGCTFDLWADDVPTSPVEVRDGVVYVRGDCGFADEAGHWRRRLEEGLSQNIDLIVAKAVIARLRLGEDYRDVVRQAALFGVRYRDGWGSGMTILTAMANLAPRLPEETKVLALYQGLSRVAADCDGQPPRRDRHALESSGADHETLKQWFRYWIRVRHRDGAERTLLTAIAGGSPLLVADILASAATDRFYADTGHALDFINKAFELLELIGWRHAAEVLPAVVRQLAAARGGEEMNAWRHPIDLVPLLNSAFDQLPDAWQAGRERSPGLEKGMGTAPQPAALAQDLLADDPQHIVAALLAAIRGGMSPTGLTKALAYAAAVRIARFGTSNEIPDWITALHTFTYANALHGLMARLPSPASHAQATLDLLRGVFHGALSVYLDRFLNIPPARLPDGRDAAGDREGPAQLCARLLELLNVQGQVEPAARAAARYLALGHPVEPLAAALALAVVREDADFHTFQMLEAGLRQYGEWGDTPEGRTILIAVARYLAAHSPTQRVSLQIAEIALRLHRGESLYEEAGDPPAGGN